VRFRFVCPDRSALAAEMSKFESVMNFCTSWEVDVCTASNCICKTGGYCNRRSPDSLSVSENDGQDTPVQKYLRWIAESGNYMGNFELAMYSLHLKNNSRNNRLISYTGRNTVGQRWLVHLPPLSRGLFLAFVCQCTVDHFTKVADTFKSTLCSITSLPLVKVDILTVDGSSDRCVEILVQMHVDYTEADTTVRTLLEKTIIQKDGTTLPKNVVRPTASTRFSQARIPLHKIRVMPNSLVPNEYVHKGTDICGDDLVVSSSNEHYEAAPPIPNVHSRALTGGLGGSDGMKYPTCFPVHSCLIMSVHAFSCLLMSVHVCS